MTWRAVEALLLATGTGEDPYQHCCAYALLPGAAEPAVRLACMQAWVHVGATVESIAWCSSVRTVNAVGPVC